MAMAEYDIKVVEKIDGGCTEDACGVTKKLEDLTRQGIDAKADKGLARLQNFEEWSRERVVLLRLNRHSVDGLTRMTRKVYPKAISKF